MIIQNLITFTVLLIFISAFALSIFMAVSKPNNARLVKSGTRYYIELKKLIWVRCCNCGELKEYFNEEHPYTYPFKNKKQAEYVYKKVIENIKKGIKNS